MLVASLGAPETRPAGQATTLPGPWAQVKGEPELELRWPATQFAWHHEHETFSVQIRTVLAKPDRVITLIGGVLALGHMFLSDFAKWEV